MDMNMIRPVSDLRNNFADISKTVHETEQPVFLTKNGYGDMVVMSMEAFEKAADGKATKIIVPSNLASIAGTLTALSETVQKDAPES